ncbi:hypothetical protein LIER_10824 [Lithospermum erythrorhizon]|uniref:Uncharacterized protein n=1 Tax=Lithospermum erythrorhizon TaxID=34254 RepID=A0AAV3PN20_LITER
MSQKHVTFLLFITLFAQTLASISSKQDEAGQWMKGTISAKIEGVPPEKVWPFIEDYCNAYKVFPLKASFCYKGDPLHVEIGHGRYMVFPNGDNFTWEKHRLVGIDRINYVLTYRMLENTNNLSYYHSVMSVLKDEYGSVLKWDYVVQSKVFTKESLRAVFEFTVQTTATNIKNLAKSS